MTAIEPGPAPAARGLVDRVKNILQHPNTEWDVIEQERPTLGALFTSYVIPLAAIPAVAHMIGSLVFGYGGFGIVIHPSLMTAVTGAIVTFVVSIVGIYIYGLIINFLAPNFGAQKDEMQAMKVAAYASTAAFVAGIFGIFPPLAVLGLLGLYSIYLLYKGLPKLMKAPPEKAVGYTATVIVVAIVLGVVLAALMSCAAGLTSGGIAALGGGGRIADSGRVEGTVKLPGGGTLDLGQMQEASKQMEDAARQMAGAAGTAGVAGAAGAAASAGVKPVDVEALKALLPGSLPGGFSRSSLSAGTGGAGGFVGSTAEGKYDRGDSRIRLSIVDMGAAGAFAAMAQAMGVQGSQESDTGYSKAGTVDGRFTTEKVDHAAKSAEFTTIVSKRFAVSAEGAGATIEEVKAAVDALGINRVEALAAATRG